MRDGQRNVSAAGFRLAASFLAASFLVVGCGGDADKSSGTASTVVAEMDSFAMDHYLGAVLRWKLTAPAGEALQDGAARVRNPRVLIYQDGAPAMTVTGDLGEVDQKTFDMRITGNVRAVAPDAVLTTRELLWKDADGRLVSPVPVEIQRGESVMFGDRMEGHPNLQTVTIYNARFKLRTTDEKREPYPLDDAENDADGKQ